MISTTSTDFTVLTTPESLAPRAVPTAMRWIDDLADARRAVKVARHAAHHPVMGGSDRPVQRQIPALLRRLER